MKVLEAYQTTITNEGAEEITKRLYDVSEGKDSFFQVEGSDHLHKVVPGQLFTEEFLVSNGWKVLHRNTLVAAMSKGSRVSFFCCRKINNSKI